MRIKSEVMEYKYDVFISYSHKDTDVADNIPRGLCFYVEKAITSRHERATFRM